MAIQFISKALFVLLTVSVFADSWKSEFKEKIEHRSPPLWMIRQIHADLSNISAPDPAALDKAMEEDWLHDGRYALVLYEIRQNQLHSTVHPNRKDNQRTVSFDASLRQLLAITTLPDMRFIVSLADEIDGVNLPAPVLAFAKDSSLSQKVILIPDFDCLESGRKLIQETTKGSKKYPWDKKKSKAFWRGALTGGAFTKDTFHSFPRSMLTSLSLAHPELVDAKFVVSPFDHPVIGELAGIYPEHFGLSFPIFEHLKYKYQILADGNSCAYARAYWQLFSNCVMFKQDSSHMQWYYRALQPYVHYIPCKRDFSDLVDQIKWAKSNDQKARKISEKAHEFAMENLKKEDLYYYLYLLLKKYSRLQ